MGRSVVNNNIGENMGRVGANTIEQIINLISEMFADADVAAQFVEMGHKGLANLKDEPADDTATEEK